MGIFDNWFDYTDVNKKVETANAARVDRPGDKLSPQSRFTQLMRDDPSLRPGMLEGFMTGANKSYNEMGQIASFGLLPGANDMIASTQGISPEAVRKMDYAVAETQPVPYALGAAVGAGAGLLGAARSGGAAALRGIGNYFAPAATELIGPAAPSAARLAVEFAKRNPATVTAVGLGGGLGVAKSDIGNYDPPTDKTAEVAPQQAGFMLDRNAAYSGKSSPAQQYWAQIHDPKTGKLTDGITPEMEARARKAIEFEAISKAQGINKGMTVAVPEDAFPGGTKGAISWQNQTGYNDAGANDPLQAAKAISLDEQFADYEAQYPGNKEGPLTTQEYIKTRRMAQGIRDQRIAEQRNAQYAAFGEQMGMSPEVVAALDRSGGLTNKMVQDAIAQQQGPARTPRVPTPQDLAFAESGANYQQLIAEARAKYSNDPAKLSETLSAIYADRDKMLRDMLTRYALPNAQAGLFPDMGGED